MRFFDTKEEVIDIELTPYGKHLLSKGQWRPVYYEFYDDDIVYDWQYTGEQEKQEEATKRIRDTKRTKAQYTFQTPATGSFLNKEASIEKRNTLYTNFLPLGKSSTIKNELPAIQIKLLSGELDDIIGTTSINGLPNNLKIINLKDNEYTIRANSVQNVEDISNIQRIYEDGTFIEILESELLIDLSEYGVDTNSDNFEISIVEIDKDDNEIRKIFFIDEQTPTKVVNNVLIDNEDYVAYIEKQDNNEFDNKKFINHFLDIKVDKEIDQNVLCKYLNKEEILRLKIVEGYDIDCGDDGEITSILSTNSSVIITEEET
jgi:hypothetical protein